MEAEPEPDPRMEEAVRTAVDRLGDGARRCGLYLGTVRVSLPSASGPSLVLADFSVGDLAFSQRVLDPDGEEDNKTVRTMEVDADLDQWNAARQRLLSGEGPIGELADDDDE
jgi:hypothetical protein